MHRYGILILGVILLVLALPVAAQNGASQPVYLVIDGDLFRTTPDGNALEPVSACALSDENILQSPVVSPDGQLLAMRIEPVLVTDALERVGGWGGGENPADVAICDPDTGFVVRFSQPEDAALFDSSGKPDTFLVRSVPAWSQDGSELAWTECEPGCQSIQLRVHHLANNETRTLATIPPQYGVPASVPVAWGGPMILVSSLEPDAATGREKERLIGFDPASGQIALDVPITQSENDFSFLMDAFWSDLESDARIVALRSSGAWMDIDPATGQMTLLTGVPELYSPSNPEGLTAVADARSAQALNLTWLAREGTTLSVLGDDVRGFTPPSLSPNGDALVFYDNLTPALWENGEQQALPLPPLSPNTPAYVAWGPRFWRTYTGPLDLPVTEFVCFGAPAPRLQVGGSAQVVIGQGANNLRSEPGTGATLLGTIPEGTVISVLDGPVCADGYGWWQVEYNGQTGWTAEGEGLDYWLEPAA